MLGARCAGSANRGGGGVFVARRSFCSFSRSVFFFRRNSCTSLKLCVFTLCPSGPGIIQLSADILFLFLFFHHLLRNKKRHNTVPSSSNGEVYSSRLFCQQCVLCIAVGRVPQHPTRKARVVHGLHFGTHHIRGVRCTQIKILKPRTDFFRCC